MFGSRLASKEAILSLITEYDIFKYYITSFKELNKPFCSEVQKDRKPSCRIILSNGRLAYQDFRETGTIDCFTYVMQKYSLSYLEVLDLINRDFNLNLMPITTKKFVHSTLEKEMLLYGDNYLNTKRSEKEIKVQLINWNGGIHKRYWYDQYGLEVKDLKRFNVYPISSFWVMSKEGESHFVSDPLCFGYYFGKINNLEKWKIYQPYSKNLKWLSNTNIDTLQGYQQLKGKSEVLIITKSLKDVMVLNKLKIDAVAPNAESCMIDDFIMLTFINYYKKIVVLFDDDKTGNLGSSKLCEKYGLSRIFLPKDTEKDVSDYVAKYGYDSLNNLIKNLIDV